MYKLLRYAMGWSDVRGRPISATPGKFIRPTLCLFACGATSGRADAALPAAVALELIHNFSLIHDEIQDRDDMRHHRPTLWTIWGDAKALVAGNALRVVADLALRDLVYGRDTHTSALEATKLLTTAYLEMIEGQYLDIQFEGRPDITMDDYLGMISRKTGALVRCSMTVGAAIGSRDKSIVDAFEESGRSLGLLFQIRDDILGIWGETETTGKPVGADIRRKKNTLPVVYTMSEARGAERQLLLDIYSESDVTDKDVKTVLQIMDRVGTRRYCESLAVEQYNESLKPLRPLNLSPLAYNEMDELAYFLVVRER